MQTDYNKTLNLPATEFSMRANLPQKEPEILEDWNKNNLFEKVIANNAGKPSFILHDGPPYANGDVHLGTAMNKVLKDIVVRSKNMSGYCAPFIPGWDTHGLPIELKALAKAGSKDDISALELRELCREYAMYYKNVQMQEFLRLGSLGNYADPYLTLKPEFEAKQIEIFGTMMKKGYIYKGLKSVYWCPEDKTALAEAEIEYAEDPVDSIYVAFNVVKDNGIFEKFDIPFTSVNFTIWTTTPWTLPANVAIALGEEFDYSIIKIDNNYYIIATSLFENVMKLANFLNYEVVATAKGSEFVGIETQHPFLNKTSLIVVSEHVTLENGTGEVHIAPGHGIEDFDLIVNNYPKLPIVVPVDDSGILTDEAGPFSGMKTGDANKPIIEYLREHGNLLAVEHLLHQYPHCWRCKNPIIFRATEQWFCSVEQFKDETINAIQSVKWTPTWGENRMAGMVRDRNDWCISRQRTWGVPIPVFYCEKCGEYHSDDNTIKAVSDLFRKEGSDAWYKYSATEILPVGTVCPKCGHDTFHKETDIMDVWFDSGSSHASVLTERDGQTWPCDLYLEGGDQYRGWFQSSLLTAVAWKGKAPYKGILSHGWVVDGEGKKMSKSIGNGILAEEIINDYGADILRWWVASSDYQVDVRISKEILKQLSESYRKIRNTARFILSNLGDFDPKVDFIPLENRLELDKWALSRLDEVSALCREAYDSFAFHEVSYALHQFCTVDMSNFYLDVIKDRLYVNSQNNEERKAAQSTMFTILVNLTKLLSPILVFTTQEIWSYIPAFEGKQEYVAMEQMPEGGVYTFTDAFKAKWDTVIALRNDVLKALELARNEKLIGASLEAQIVLYCSNDLLKFAKENEDSLAEWFIVSKVSVEEGPAANTFIGELESLQVKVEKAIGHKCERCWMYTEDVGSNVLYPTICKRCADILNS